MSVSIREQSEERYPVVHMHRGSAIRRPLIVLAVCAVAALGYVARDFLIPTAGAVVLALILTPVAKTFERLRVPSFLSAAASVVLLAMGLAVLLAISIPALTNWIDQTPYLTYTLERKLEGVRNVGGARWGTLEGQMIDGLEVVFDGPGKRFWGGRHHET